MISEENYVSEISEFLQTAAEKEEDGYNSDTSVIMPIEPVKQVRADDLLKKLETPKQAKLASLSKNDVITPSKISSLLDEEDDDDFCQPLSESEDDQENITPKAAETKCLSRGKMDLIEDETQFQLYLSSSPAESPEKPIKTPSKNVLHQIQNVLAEKSASKPQIADDHKSINGNSEMRDSKKASKMQDLLKNDLAAPVVPRKEKVLSDDDVPLKKLKSKSKANLDSDDDMPINALKKKVVKSSEENILKVDTKRTGSKDALNQQNKEAPATIVARKEEIISSDEDVPLKMFKSKSKPIVDSDEDMPINSLKKKVVKSNEKKILKEDSNRTCSKNDLNKQNKEASSTVVPRKEKHVSSDEDVPLKMLKSKSKANMDSDEDKPINALKKKVAKSTEEKTLTVGSKDNLNKQNSEPSSSLLARKEVSSDEDVPLKMLKSKSKANTDSDEDKPISALKKKVAVKEVSNPNDSLMKKISPCFVPLVRLTGFEAEKEDDVPLKLLKKKIDFPEEPAIDEEIPLSKLKKDKSKSAEQECMDGANGKKKKQSSSGSESDRKSAKSEGSSSGSENPSNSPQKSSSGSDGDDGDKNNGKGRNFKSFGESSDEKPIKKKLKRRSESDDSSSDDGSKGITKKKKKQSAAEKAKRKQKMKPSTSSKSVPSDSDSEVDFAPKKKSLGSQKGARKSAKKNSNRFSASDSEDDFVSTKNKKSPGMKKVKSPKKAALEIKNMSDSDDEKPLRKQPAKSPKASESGKQLKQSPKKRVSQTSSDDEKPLKKLKKTSSNSEDDDSFEKDIKKSSESESDDSVIVPKKSPIKKSISGSSKKRPVSASKKSCSSESDRKTNTKQKNKPTKKAKESSSSDTDDEAPLSKIKSSGSEKEKTLNMKEIKNELAFDDEKKNSSSSSDDEKPVKVVSKSPKPNGNKKTVQKNSSSDSSDDEKDVKKESSSSSDDDEKPLSAKSGTNLKNKDSDSESDDLPLKAIAKGKEKSQPAKKEKKETKHSKKIDRMKRYLKEAGALFVPYKKISEQCNGNEKKMADKLLLMLQEMGVKGTPTLEKCKRLKKKLEIKKDVESLDLDNIIGTSGPRSRRSESKPSVPVKRKAANSDSDEHETKKKFSRLKALADSDSSD